MPNQVLRRRGTEAQHQSFTGGTGEITYITDNIFLSIHTSSQVGGFVVPKLTANKRTLDSNGILYANSTTTLTTSSAFTWDGTTFTVDGNLTFTGAQTIATSTGALTINTGSAAAINFNINGTNAWSITSGSILQSNGAQTIQTSTGNLTIATAAGNGNIVLSPNGAGDVIVNTTQLVVDTSAAMVGIGTAIPSALLEARTDQSSNTAIKVSNRSTNVAAYAQLHVSAGAAGAENAYFVIFPSTWTGGSGLNAANSCSIQTDRSQMGIGTANASGILTFYTGSSGERVRIDASGKVGLMTTTPTYDLSFGGNAARTIGLERHTTADTAGVDLTIRAGGATTGATNKAGGNLVLVSGISTGTGDSTIKLYTYTDASETLVVTVGTGVQIGAPTGGDKGAGTINVAGDIYKNDSAYTNPDYVFEHAYTGKITIFANNPGAKEYKGKMPLQELKDYTRQHHRLPLITNNPLGIFERGDIILAALEEAYLYIFELEDRINKMDNKVEKV